MVRWAKKRAPRLDLEATLVDRARAGDRSALARLFEIHYPAMLQIALRVTRDLDRALDALQDSCVRVIQHIGSFRGESRFSSWMGSIVANAARLQFRAERRFVPLTIDKIDRQVSFEPCPETKAGHRQELARAVQQLQGGRDGDYQLFVRRFVVGESVRAVSLDTGLSIPSVKTRVHRARVRLKRAIEHRP